jgi:hypothetical protein
MTQNRLTIHPVGYMDTKKSATKVRIYCVGIALALGLACLILFPGTRVAVHRTLFPGACISEERMSIPNLSDMEFKVIYTNCDIFEVSVYVRRAARNGESFPARWLNRRTLLFSYDAERWDDPPPSIKASDSNRILISIPKVSSVLFQRRNLRNVSIDYNIGRVYYP